MTIKKIQTLKEAHLAHILRALETYEWKRSSTATALGISEDKLKTAITDLENLGFSVPYSKNYRGLGLMNKKQKEV